MDSIYQMRKNDEKGMPRSNVGGWHSHDEIYEIKKFKPLVGDILKYAKDCLTTWILKIILSLR